MKNYDTHLIHADGRETKMAETWTEQEAIDAADMAVSGRVDCRAVVCRTDSSALAPALYEVASAPAVEAAPIIADITKEIKYCRATRDYDLYVTIDGGTPQYIGSASDYGQGEVITNQYAYDYLMDSHTIETATELLMELPASAFCGDEGDIECSLPDNMCSVHNPCPAHAADAARYLASESDCEPKADPIRIRIQRGAEIVQQSTGKATAATYAFMVVAERDRQSGCMLFAMPSRGLCYVMEGWVRA